MGDTNYIGSIVKILESPNQKLFNNTIPITQFRVQLPQIRNNTIVTLNFWGNLANDVANYYKINDYIIIEGYLSVRTKPVNNSIIQNSKKVEIAVFKVYPFLLSLNNNNNNNHRDN
jgi:single-stranded DNA-binding protein